MGNIKSLQWRYATKKFDDSKQLSSEQIAILKESFNLTPTSYGLQPLKLVVIQHKELQEQLLEHSAHQQQVVTASHLLVICIEKNVNSEFIKQNFELVKDIRETPEKILKPFREFLLKDFKNKTDEEIKIWAVNQAYLALGNLLTVCAHEGIDACPMEGFNAEKYDEVLNLDEKNLQSVLILPVGYRAEDDIFADLKKVRRPMEETIIEIKE
ncbi:MULTISPECIES: NAD(P)H-dependent oxidoreductase [Mesonia]|uniref:NAD(P)H nitroreductase n=1 Tax=Mesonia oceanica TaxID=2687242 RepID=A0AC61YBU2_9FLAO|nr:MULTISPECIES: NAD(P)H-dependent oxidoreductase [Mesonia]MAN29187.1 NAD(P)H-dependent oxidoreductase [Mesonia sp.]MAQ39989.1 NAD(P)H-dependent oxidoreductase [Mesonia sp.]MBJ99122.1 NAD(P)H-dependent oxidoreductase [Flavobacteriaceae bacterium]VVV01966.1 Putative NAD(P)H nitroreductase [Mesonia oceanica]|tara:strand:+ start:114593 stop:115228 length:636 start_codon:yes stop_codon:yes gene_type:complete